MEATISLLLPHPSSLKHNHHTCHLLHLPTSLTSFPCQLYAIRPRNFELSGVQVNDDDDDDNGSKTRRKKSGRKWWRKQRRRPWWDFEDDHDEYDRLRGDYKAVSFEYVVDSILIFRVLRSYGWFLPFILLSVLLATGPKAFLIAFSIPLGLSLVILAFQKLREWLNESLKPRRRRRTRSPFSLENVFLMEEDDGFEGEIRPKRRIRRRDYRSWECNEDSTTRTKNFGGWDDLVSTERETRYGRRNPNISTSKVPVEEKLKRSVEERDLPLLLRLLIALFPFLGSWTELL